MKVESQYTIEGKVVTKEFENSEIIVYDHTADYDHQIIYFVSKKTGKVIFKQDVTASMGQGCGFINGISYEEVK